MLGLLLTVSAGPARGATGTHEQSPCPADRRALLRDDPERLIACRDSALPEDRIWAAHALAALNRFRDAAAVLDGVGKKTKSPTLKAALALTAAYDDARAGAPRDGLRRLVGLKLSRRWLRAAVAATRADLSLQAGDWEAATRAARDAIALHAPSADALELVLARAAAGHADRDGFTAALRTMEIDFPESEATRAAEALTTSELALPVLDTAQLADRWAHLISRGRAQQVSNECALKQGQLPPGDAGARARFECGVGFATTHHPSAKETLQQAADALGSGKAAARALLLLARIAGHTKVPEAVRAICAQIDRAQDDAAECYFLAAFVTQEAGHPEAARAAFASIRDGFPRSSRARDAAWFLAFDTYEHDRPHAFAAFDALLSGKSYGIDRAQLLYWRGRSRPPEQAELARSDWTATLERDPFGYYGWLAATRLGLDAADATDTACVAAKTSTATPPKGAADAQLLFAAGFGRYAELELEEALPRGARQRRPWLEFLTELRQYERVVIAAVALGGESGAWPAAPERLPLVEAAFPRAYAEALSAAPPGANRCLLLSLMRRESRFNPDVVSAAQAHGLMQLLPTTAGSVAKELGQTPPSTEELHDPAINVRFASEYVRRLQLRFGHPLLVAAAYNGGPRNVATWMTDMAGVDFDEWVERIPFRETRHYVKAVGGAYASYGLIYSGQRPPLDLTPVKAATVGIDY